MVAEKGEVGYAPHDLEEAVFLRPRFAAKLVDETRVVPECLTYSAYETISFRIL